MSRPPSDAPIRIYPGTHSPSLAALLTLLLMTGGQFYNHQHLKAIVTLLAGMVLILLTAGVALFVLYPVCAFDAYRIGQRLNEGETVTAWQWF